VRDQNIAEATQKLDPVTIVTAPIGGTITQRQIGLGQYINSTAVGASGPVYTIGPGPISVRHASKVGYRLDAEAHPCRFTELRETESSNPSSSTGESVANLAFGGGYPAYGYPGYAQPGYGYRGYSGYPAYSGPPGYGYQSPPLYSPDSGSGYANPVPGYPGDRSSENWSPVAGQGIEPSS